MKFSNPDAYELIESRQIKDLNSTGYLLRHKKTGAKVVCLENDDKNKVFYIGFRTPPTDSTGVAHIIEHSVLCGSKKYPVKDPFVELAKGSLNTFLNAMTYPDKTVYPVASCNDRDFRNLMDVYLDAVFHPNIYVNEKIFKQEGWHYELESEDEPLKLNGVVYSEMKGVFSSPDDMLDRYVFNSLFPDTCYGVESGGDPDYIPELSYDEFVDFHKAYYHPSNSYIYLYGDMDFESQLKFIDEEYLSEFDYLDIDSSIKSQEAFSGVNEESYEYPITNDEPLEDNTYLAYNFVIKDSLDKELYIAFQILDYALLSAPGAVLKQALLDRGLGKDIDSTYENGIKQPYFSIIAKNTNASEKEKFIATIKEVLDEVVKCGIDKKSLLAGINVFEFKYREADFGSYPKGLMYGLQALDSWLYDDSEPFMHIEALDTFAFLKEQVEKGYFEELVKKYFLDNPHSSVVVLSPKRGLLAANDRKLEEKLSSYKASCTPEDIKRIIRETKELKEYQQQEDSEEALKCIPLLKISDIDTKAEEFVNCERLINNKTILTHDVFTNGIGYLCVCFNVNRISKELLPYVGILKACLGMVNTKNYTYAELANEIFLNSGGIYATGNVYNNVEDCEKYTNYIEFRAKILYDKLDFAFNMFEEIAYTSDFTDRKRIREIICMLKSRLSQGMVSSGHSVAVLRSTSHLFEAGMIREYMGGIEFYRVIEEIESDFDNKCDDLIDKLQTVSKMIFNKDNLELIDYTCQDSEKEKITCCAERFIDNCPEESYEIAHIPFERKKESEAYTTSGMVCFVSQSGMYADDKHPYTGALKVLKTIMGYDYLWNRVRVLGGAYGCFGMFSRTGIASFVSYRDPNLSGTLKVYEEAVKYLENFTASERDMNKYIIGTISDMDLPLTPSQKGNRSREAYICKDSYDKIQKDRDEVLKCTGEEIKALAGYIKNMLSDETVCVIGGEEIVNKDNTKFTSTQSLFKM